MGMRQAMGAAPPIVGCNVRKGGWSATWEARDGRCVLDHPLWGVIYARGGRRHEMGGACCTACCGA